jgi:lysozyme family protein
MANFNLFYPKLLEIEGGIVHHPADKGGLTNKGITIKTFKEFAERLLGIEPTEANLRKLTTEQALTIYKNVYWNGVNANKIYSQLIAETITDHYINAGKVAMKIAQRVTNSLGKNLLVDGVIGDKTITAINTSDEATFLEKYNKGREEYYRGLVKKDATQKDFLTGWLNRIKKFTLSKKKQ